jgi:hypothetical protein
MGWMKCTLATTAGFLKELEKKVVAFLKLCAVEIGRAEPSAPLLDLKAQAVLCLSLMSALPNTQTNSPGAQLLPPSHLCLDWKAMSEPSKAPQWDRMSMCFLNQKGGFSLAKAAQPNKQKPVN